MSKNTMSFPISTILNEARNKSTRVLVVSVSVSKHLRLRMSKAVEVLSRYIIVNKFPISCFDISVTDSPSGNPRIVVRITVLVKVWNGTITTLSQQARDVKINLHSLVFADGSNKFVPSSRIEEIINEVLSSKEIYD